MKAVLLKGYTLRAEKTLPKHQVHPRQIFVDCTSIMFRPDFGVGKLNGRFLNRRNVHTSKQTLKCISLNYIV